MKPVAAFIFLTFLLLGAGFAFGQDPAGESFTVIGKSYCPLKYYVNSPNKGEEIAEERRKDILENPSMKFDDGKKAPAADKSALMTGLEIDKIKLTKVFVSIGDKVQEEQPLAAYEIPLENIITQKEKLSKADLKYYEYLLSQVNNTLEDLRSRRDEFQRMLKYQSVSPQEMQQNLGEIEVNLKRRDYLEQVLKEEMRDYGDRLEVAESYYGKDVEKMIYPKDGFVRSQLSGYVIWMNFDARAGKIFTAKTPLFLIGILDPMVVRCAVHEIKALKLKVGDPAKVVFHTMPDKVYETTVSKVSFVAQPAMMQQPSFYEIELTIPNPDHVLKEGLRCDVTITPGG